MTHRKVFVAVADALGALRPRPDAEPERFESWGECVRALAITFKHDNPRFDEGRFFKACGWFPEIDYAAENGQKGD